MKYYRVKVPVVRERSLRRVEPGTTLAKDCSSPSGQLLFRKGVELDLDRISRLERFEVRRVSVEVEEEQWLSRPEIEDLPGSPEILDEKEVEEPGEESSESESEDESRVLDEAFLRLMEGTSINETQNLARKLRRLLRQQDESPERIDGIVNELYGLEDDIETLDEELKAETSERKRRRILRAIRGLIDEDISDLTEGLEEQQRDRAQELGEGVEELRTDLISYLHENTEPLLETLRQQDSLPDVSPEKTPSGSTPSGDDVGAPDAPDVALRDLFGGDGLDQLLDLLENERLFETLMEQYKSRVEGKNPSAEDPERSDPPDSSPEDELAERLRQSLGELQEHSEKERRLQRDIHREVNEQELVNRLSEMVEDGQLDDSIPSRDHPILQNLMERIQSFIHEQESMKDQVEQLMERMTRPGSESKIEQASGSDRSPADKATAADPEPPAPGGTPVDLSRSMELFEEGNWTDALDEMLEQIDNLPRGSEGLEGRLQALREQMEEKISQRDQIREEIRDEAGDEGVRERLIRVLDGNQELTLDEMAQSGISADLLQSIADYQTGRDEWTDQLEEVMARMFETFSSDVKQDREEFVDRVSSAYETEKRTGDTARSPQSDPSELDISTRKTGKGETVPRLPEEVQKTAQLLYDRPEDLNKWQRHLIDPLEELIDGVLKEAHWTRQAGVRFIRRVKEILASTRRPFELLALNIPVERYLLAHSYNAALVCVMLGEHLEVENERMVTLVSAAAWMDLGLTAVPMSMFLHEGTLSVRGRQEVHKHPIYSWKIVGRATGTESVPARLVLNHHERVNGQGYPFQRAFEEQPPLTPLLGASDVYTSLLEPRTFRDGLMPNEALTELENDEEQFHPRVVEGIREQIGLYPTGSVVKISDGRIAMVSRQNPEDDHRPDLLVFTDSQRNKLSKPEKLSLREDSEKEIDRILRRNIHENLTG